MTTTMKRTAGRRRLDQKLNPVRQHLERKYPGNDVKGIAAFRPDIDVASMRSARQAAQPTIDTSNWLWMLEHNRRHAQQDYELAHAGRFHWRTNPADYKELAQLMQQSMQDQSLQVELAQYRNFEITSDIQAIPFALGAFQQINLSADELPQMITPRTRQYFNVRYIGQDGGARQDQWRTARQAVNIEMRLLSTDRVEYPLMDLQQGDVNEFDIINAQLRFDMEMKIETAALDVLNANYSATGIKALLNVHPTINKDNIPDGNYLDLRDVPTYGPLNVFTITRLKAILNHMAMWGFGFDPDGPISLSTMIMSPLNARDSWDYIDLVSGWDTEGKTWGTPDTSGRLSDDPRTTVPTAMREQIWSGGGMLQNAWGYRWSTQYNPRLSKGRLYIFTNQPVGWFFTKTEWDRIIEWRDLPDFIEQNIGAVLHRRAIQFFMPDLWRYRFLVVDF